MEPQEVGPIVVGTKADGKLPLSLSLSLSFLPSLHSVAYSFFFPSAKGNRVAGEFFFLARHRIWHSQAPDCMLIDLCLSQPPDRESDWAGLCLADEEVLSAFELHEEFTKKRDSGSMRSRTRLMALCACSSGAVPRECDSRRCLSCQHHLVHFADDGAESRSRSLQARGSARLCPNCAGWRHSMSAGVEMERPRQGEHHSHDASLRLYGSEEGWTIGRGC